MISEQKVKEWIDLYLKHIEEITPEVHVRDEEGYKFKAVNTFQQQFSIDASNLAENLDHAIEPNNLVAGSWYFPRKMLLIFAENHEQETRQALQELFDESRPVAERIDHTEKTFDRLMEARNREFDADAHSFIGIRFLSLLLGYRYPDIHNALKPREWKLFCRYIDDNFEMPSHTSSGEQYEIYAPYIEKLRVHIKDISKIVNLRDQLTRGLEFEDKEFHWMTQNVIYVTARVLAGQRGAEKFQQEPLVARDMAVEDSEGESGAMEFPLEEYLENFIVRNWNSIDFGEPLTLYVDDEGAPAQQYPTSEGFIDLLAKDADGNFVVIELKKGRSNQQVVGQILSYVGWVKNNLAEKDKRVRGVIVAADGNPALLDAVSTVRDFISVKYYRVKFNFENPQ
jgi:hypothetical protein